MKKVFLTFCVAILFTTLSSCTTYQVEDSKKIIFFSTGGAIIGGLFLGGLGGTISLVLGLTGSSIYLYTKD